MRRMLVMLAVAFAMPAAAQAQNLLVNGNLNDQTQIGDPAFYYTTPTGWSISTNPQSFPQPGNPNPPIVRYPTFPATYADRLAAGNGVVFNSTEGNFPGFPDVLTVDGDLTQVVPGTPGLIYRMSGYAYFEGGYAGGVDVLAPTAPAPRGGQPSLTDTFFALEFLDSLNAVLPGSVQIELKAAGQVNNPDITETTRNWLQHVLTATAPAGTASVRVRASMVDGEFNVDLPHQAAWIDDFSLTVVPEPSTSAMALAGLFVLRARRRRR
jgi:hypothetical protein